MAYTMCWCVQGADCMVIYFWKSWSWLLLVWLVLSADIVLIQPLIHTVEGHLFRSFNITSSRLCIGIGRFLMNIWCLTRWHSCCSPLLSAPVSSLSQLYPSGNTYFGLQIFTAYLILQFVINNIWYIVYIVYSIDRVESKKNIAIITLEESVLKC